MRISDWSSDVCSSDLHRRRALRGDDARPSAHALREAAMTLAYETVDVFTDTAFGGNPLAVVFGAEKLPATAMQRIATEFNYAETSFVVPPQNPAHTAGVRIFTPTMEVPFAGHPNVGTATVLAWRGEAFGRPVVEIGRAHV